MTDRRASLEIGLGRGDELSALAQPVLLEQRASEHQLRGADLGDVIFAIGEEIERLACLCFGTLELADVEVDLGERAERVPRLRCETHIDEGPERLAELTRSRWSSSRAGD